METDVSVETTPPSGEAAKDSYSGNEDRSIYRARACLRCSRSKLRCMRTADPSVKPCVRCARLGAECTIPEAKPRGPRRGQGRRVGQLEQKLDGIMSLLTASKHLLNEQRQPKPGSGPSTTTPTVLEESRPEAFGRVFPPGPGLLTSAPSHTPSAHEYVPVATPESLSHRTDPSPKATPPERATTSVAESVAAMDEEPQPQRYDIFPGLELSNQGAQAVLDSYRNLYLPNFPFVPISSKVTPATMFAKSPLLFRTIMLSCAPQSPALQREGDRWFRSHIAQRVVVNGEKNLEILQSIIIFVAWCDYRFFIHSKGTSLLQLALGIVMDLGLNKPPIAGYTPKHYAMINEAFRRVPYFSIRSSYCREDMRAMLGAFYCATLAATLFRREHHLPYTDFIDRCCSELLELQEYPTDKSLVAIIKMMCLVRRAHSLIPGAYPCPDTSVMFTPSVAIGLSALRREMEDMAASFTSLDSATSHFLRLHYHGSMIAIHEPVIYARSAPPAAVPMLPLGPTSPQGLNRVDALWHCLRASSGYIDAYAELPVEIVGLQPLMSSAHLAFSFVTATRLLFLQDSDWDTSAARRIFDFPAVTSRMTDVLAAGEAFHIRGTSSPSMTYRRRFQDDDRTPLLSAYLAKVLWLRQWYMARTAPAGHNVAPPGDDPLAELMANPMSNPNEKEGGDSGQQLGQTELPAQQHLKEAGAPPEAAKGAQFLGDPAAASMAFDPQNLDPVAFDLSYLDTLDDSFWHAFMMDPQMSMPPMQIDPTT